MVNGGGIYLKKRAGDEEKAIAIANGRYHQGVPTITDTVTIDGGWSKHSHNAKSGVGIIIGKQTKAIGKNLLQQWRLILS